MLVAGLEPKGPLKFSDAHWIDNEFQDSGAQQLGNQPKHSDSLQISHQARGLDTH